MKSTCISCDNKAVHTLYFKDNFVNILRKTIITMIFWQQTVICFRFFTSHNKAFFKRMTKNNYGNKSQNTTLLYVNNQTITLLVYFSSKNKIRHRRYVMLFSIVSLPQSRLGYYKEKNKHMFIFEMFIIYTYV